MLPTESIIRRKSFKDIYETFIQFDRVPDPKDKSVHDCLYKTRKQVISVPYDCYWDSNRVNRQIEFWNFWNQQGPDIMYTFDFILYNDRFYHDHINRLWFIIAYVKIIAMEIENPLDIVTHVKELNLYKKLYNQMNSRIVVLEQLIAHMFTNKGTFVDNNIVINNKPLLSRVTLYDKLTTEQQIDLIGGNIHVNTLDKENKDIIVEENKNIKIKPLLLF